MDIENMDFGEALRELAKRTGIKLTSYKPDPKSRQREDILKSLALAKQFYHWLLTSHDRGKQAREYLEKRGIKSETIKTFKIGWAPDDWDGLYKYLTLRKSIPIQSIEGAGLVSRSKSGRYFDRFRGRVIFPLQNPRGQTLGFSGRIVPFVNYGNYQPGKYINTAETEVYHKRELLYGLEISKTDIKKKDEVIIVEGELDMISSWQVGVKQVVAIKGTALTPEQLIILKRYAPTLTLALDMDLAGDQAARKGIQQAQVHGLEVKVVVLPEGQDPDDLAKSQPDKWKEYLSNAVDVYQYYLDSAMKRFGTKSAQSKKKITDELLPIWKAIPSQIVQAHWVGELAKQLQIDEKVIMQEMKKISNLKVRHQPQSSINIDPKLKSQSKKEPEPPVSRRQKLEELIAGMILKKDWRKMVEERLVELFNQTWIQRLVKIIEEKIQTNNDKTDNTQLSDLNLPSEIQSKVAEVLMLADFQTDHRLSVEQMIDQLEIIDIQEQRRNLRQKISLYEQSEQSEKLIENQKKFDQLNIRLAELTSK